MSLLVGVRAHFVRFLSQFLMIQNSLLPRYIPLFQQFGYANKTEALRVWTVSHYGTCQHACRRHYGYNHR